MSLNGLDDPAIKEAYETAVSEPGGWFLLKYSGRNDVDLLGRGNGGIVEIRNSIAQYEEASPLYGFLRYRRRNVIIKYLPDNCSRLIQARVSVHFNAVCERFAPYNTTFSIAAAKELKDTKLSAACSLHTASSSTSSSTSSLRRRRLMEIAEEEEEEHRATKRQSVVKEEDRPATQDGSSLAASALPPVSLNSQLAKSPNELQFAGTTEPPPFTGIERPSSPAKSLDARRLSSQLTRPEMYSYSSYQYGKPKVKLAPRPSLDVSGRPRTSAGTGNYRPVSSIPAGFKLFSKGSKRGKANGNSTRDSVHHIEEEEKTDSSGVPASDAVTAAVVASIPIPADPPDTLDVKRPHTSGGRPTSSSGISVKSVATTAATPSATRQSTMTMEKARLMKAMKLREKKKKMSVQPPLPIPTVDIVEVPPEAKDDAPAEELSDSASAAAVSVADSLDGRLGLAGDPGPNTTFTRNAESADSAVDFGLSTNDQASVDTRTTDSHPTSPMGMSSEIGDSTKASSLSESTDETIQALQELKSELNTDERDVKQLEVSVEVSLDDHNSTVEVGKLAVAGQDTAENIALDQTIDEGQEPSLEKESRVERLNEETWGVQDQGIVQVQPPNATLPEEGEAKSALPKTKASADDIQASVTDVVDSIRPTSSAASDISTDLEPALPATANLVPTIAMPESRDSRSTIGLESSDTASVDTKRARRRAIIDPIRTDLGNLEKESARSEANLSDDEALMEELQSATVQEAKPMTVSKSPVNPVFPNLSPSKQLRGMGDGNNGPATRTVSNPMRSTLLTPGDAVATPARSVSSGAAFLNKMAQQTSANLTPKKTNIGSSISQRIKALEKLSNSAGPASEAPPRVERPTSTFFSVRKASGREPSKSPSIAERASSLTRDKTPSPPTSRESSPEMPKLTPRDRSGSMASRLSVFEGGNMPRGRPESIQVKARIIRDPAQPFPKMPDPHFDPAELGQLDLKQSPLVVDHQKGTPAPLPTPVSAPAAPLAAETAIDANLKRESIQERRMSKEKRRSQSQDRATDEPDGVRPRRRSSLSIVKDFIKERRGSILGARSPSTDNLTLNGLASPAPLPTPSKSPSRPPSVHTTTGLARRLSISSRRSSTSKDRDLNTPPLNIPFSPSGMTETSGSGDDSRPSTSDHSHKKSGSGSKNRASRFMRRLSSSLSAGRKATTPTISPTVAEEEEVFSTIPPSRGSLATLQPSIVSYIGDVNVQFPDNLLWKRRTMCLDSQGFLILSTVHGVTATTTAASMINGDRPAGAIKRYHLSDFRLPYIPEMEVQELPNSVCLDFVDGSGLQIACEDRAGQLNVLQILQESHQNHTSFGQ